MEHIMTDFEAMRTEFEAELIEARACVTQAETDAANAVAAHRAAQTRCTDAQTAIAPLGNAVTSTIAGRLHALDRELRSGLGDVTRTSMLAEQARGRVADLALSIEQVERLMKPAGAEPDAEQAEAVAQ